MIIDIQQYEYFYETKQSKNYIKSKKYLLKYTNSHNLFSSWDKHMHIIQNISLCLKKIIAKKNSQKTIKKRRKNLKKKTPWVSINLMSIIKQIRPKILCSHWKIPIFSVYRKLLISCCFPTRSGCYSKIFTVIIIIIIVVGGGRGGCVAVLKEGNLTLVDGRRRITAVRMWFIIIILISKALRGSVSIINLNGVRVGWNGVVLGELVAFVSKPSFNKYQYNRKGS